MQKLMSATLKFHMMWVTLWKNHQLLDEGRTSELIQISTASAQACASTVA